MSVMFHVIIPLECLECQGAKRNNMEYGRIDGRADNSIYCNVVLYFPQKMHLVIEQSSRIETISTNWRTTAKAKKAKVSNIGM